MSFSASGADTTPPPVRHKDKRGTEPTPLPPRRGDPIARQIQGPADHHDVRKPSRWYLGWKFSGLQPQVESHLFWRCCPLADFVVDAGFGRVIPKASCNMIAVRFSASTPTPNGQIRSTGTQSKERHRQHVRSSVVQAGTTQRLPQSIPTSRVTRNLIQCRPDR